MEASLHDDALIIDATLPVGHDRVTFEALRAGGVTAINHNGLPWQGFMETMRMTAELKAAFAENSDLVRQVYSTEDILAAKQEGRVGIILGWQNTSPIEDKLYYLSLFKELGVGIVQLTYNTANWVGGGCYESTDYGLTDFGRDVVAELNRLGILIDLSHCGTKTAADAIAASEQPVAYTHVCPSALHPHARNKTDDELRAVAESGGVIGVALCPTFLHSGPESTLDDYVDAIEHVVELVGEDHVGLGTDLMERTTPERIEFAIRDKGYGRFHIGDETVEDIIEPLGPRGFGTLAERPNLTANLHARNWPESRIRKLLGENWLRLLKHIWGA
jgi:membrane dipeptidase